jgi:hypothetical protein
MAARLVKLGTASQSGVERRLIVAQDAPLVQLVILLRSLLQRAEKSGLSVDYNDLYWTLAQANNPNSVSRAKSRQRLLEAFYQEFITIQQVASDGTSENIEPPSNDPTRSPE